LGDNINITLIYFAKAFNKVPHESIAMKLENLGWSRNGEVIDSKGCVFRELFQNRSGFTVALFRVLYWGQYYF